MRALTGADLFESWWNGITSDTPEPTWSSGDPIFDDIEIAPGRIVLIGGAPGAGKTSLIGQWVVGLLATHPELRCLVANVEMPPFALLNRHLARISGVPLTTIRRRACSPDEQAKLEEAAPVVRDLIDRLAFADDPHRLESIAREGSDFAADLVVVDYLQRVEPLARSSGLRERMNALMSELRRLADKGNIGIIAAAAVSRTRDNAGRSSYAGQHLGLASLRESGELEFGADDVLLLSPTDDEERKPVRSMLLHHAKSRYGEPRDVALEFDRRIQRFAVDPWVDEVSPSPSRPNGRAVEKKPANRGKG